MYFSLVGCDTYQGDGNLISHGSLDANKKYTLDLGNISLSKNGFYKYTSSFLPNDKFVFGLEIFSKNVIENPLPINAHLELIVTDSMGVKVIEESAPIVDWVWTIARDSNHTFVYRRGEKGTYLSVNPNDTYSINLNVTNADESGNIFKAKFIGQAGGWK
mgnify:FL=1